MSLTISQLVGLQTSKVGFLLRCLTLSLVSILYPNHASFGSTPTPSQQHRKYFNVAGLAILVFDYMIALEDEVRWVWGRRWDPTRCVFMVVRYLPFAGAGMTAYSSLRTNTDPCLQSLTVDIVHIIGVVAAEVLLVLRTYAFWQGDKRVLYGLLAYGCAAFGAAIAINVLPQQLIPEEALPSTGCLLVSSTNSTFVYLFLLVFEIVILSLTAYKRFRFYRGTRTSTILTIYRDGVFYIFCIILITFSNILLNSIFPVQFSDLLDNLQITLHSVLASRILFNLRKSSRYEERERLTNSMSLDNFRTSDPHQQPQRRGSESLGPLIERSV